MPSPADPIFLQFGPFAVRWYGVLIVVGVLVAAYVGSIEAARRGEDKGHVGNMVIWSLIFGLIGSRLYHVLSTPAGASRDFSYYFVERPFATLSLFGIAVPFPTALFIWEGGLGILGGIAGGVLAIFLYTRRHRLDVWSWLDIAVPGTLLAQAIGQWGNFFNQELYGLPTGWPWGITITNVNQRIPPYNNLSLYPLDTTFHPVFLYESIWSLTGFVLLMWFSRRYAHRLHPGDIFSLYLVWYPLGRLCLEALRPDAWTVLVGLPTAQIISVLLILIGLALLFQRHRPYGLAWSAPGEAFISKSGSS